MKYLGTIVELFNWFWIFISPTVIIGFIGYALYYNYRGTMGVILFVAFAVAGIALGIYFAERIRRTVGCTIFITRVAPWSDDKNKKG